MSWRRKAQMPPEYAQQCPTRIFEGQRIAAETWMVDWDLVHFCLSAYAAAILPCMLFWWLMNSSRWDCGDQHCRLCAMTWPMVAAAILLSPVLLVYDLFSMMAEVDNPPRWALN